MSIRRMVDAIIDRNIPDGKRINTLKATNIVSVLLGRGSALMVRVDATI